MVRAHVYDIFYNEAQILSQTTVHTKGETGKSEFFLICEPILISYCSCCEPVTKIKLGLPQHNLNGINPVKINLYDYLKVSKTHIFQRFIYETKFFKEPWFFLF